MKQFFVEDNQIGKEFITITGKDAKQIKDVLKLEIGDKIRITSRGGEDAICEIAAQGDGFVQAKILQMEEIPKTDASCDLYLFQALTSYDRMDCVVQKASELGIYEIIPVVMKNCTVKVDEKKVERKRTRWQTLCDEAADQAGRSYLPHVHPLMSYKDALSYARTHCEISLVPYEKERNIKSTRAALRKLKSVRSVGIFIGPEQGFAEDEIEEVLSDMEVISLGSQVLNTDTAAICALYLVNLALEQQ